MCSSKTMGRSILGATTIKRETYATVKYYIWPCYGGRNLIFAICWRTVVCINVLIGCR